MTSPAPQDPGQPIVDRFGGNKKGLNMRPNPPKKKPKQPKLTIQPLPTPGNQYMPVNKSKMVNKVYKTY